MMSHPTGKLPMGNQAWAEEDDRYLFGAHKEESVWNREEIRHLNDQGGARPPTLWRRISAFVRKMERPSRPADLRCRRTIPRELAV